MRVLVQWTRAHPRGWEEVDSAAFGQMPVRPLPGPGVLGGADDVPGWVHRLNVQGVELTADHYAVEPLPGGGCRVFAWNDDPEDYPPGEKYARVLEFLPLAPDARFGGAWNTRQRQVVYAEPAVLGRMTGHGPVEHTEFRPWAEFVAPPEMITRHGVWVADALNARHDAALTVRGWREWIEGVPAEMLEYRDGRPIVRPQRTIGLFNQPHGTKTVYARDTDLATGIHATIAAANENEFNEATGAAAAEASAALAGGASGLLYCFTSLAGFPNDAAWPTGTYRFQLDVTAAGADITYGLRAAGTATGHFARVDSGLTADLETKAQVEALFSLSGLKLATTGSVSWAAGAAGDRWECLVAGTRAASHGNQSITLELNETDDFSDGPWVAPLPEEELWNVYTGPQPEPVVTVYA